MGIIHIYNLVENAKKEKLRYKPSSVIHTHGFRFDYINCPKTPMRGISHKHLYGEFLGICFIFFPKAGQKVYIPFADLAEKISSA